MSNFGRAAAIRSKLSTYNKLAVRDPIAFRHCPPALCAIEHRYIKEPSEEEPALALATHKTSSESGLKRAESFRVQPVFASKKWRGNSPWQSNVTLEDILVVLADCLYLLST